jgi:hypothetical protein
VLGETMGGAVVGQYRFVILVAVLPLVFVALAWQALRWREARHARAD